MQFVLKLVQMDIDHLIATFLNNNLLTLKCKSLKTSTANNLLVYYRDICLYCFYKFPRTYQI